MACSKGPNKEKPWYINIASYRLLKDAEKATDRLDQLDIEAYIISTASKAGNIWHEVDSGIFAKKKEAKEYLKKLRKAGIKSAKIKN